jgi:hypothetical protein
MTVCFSQRRATLGLIPSLYNSYPFDRHPEWQHSGIRFKASLWIDGLMSAIRCTLPRDSTVTPRLTDPAQIRRYSYVNMSIIRRNFSVEVSQNCRPIDHCSVRSTCNVHERRMKDKSKLQFNSLVPTDVSDVFALNPHAASNRRLQPYFRFQNVL